MVSHDWIAVGLKINWNALIYLYLSIFSLENTFSFFFFFLNTWLFSSLFVKVLIPVCPDMIYPSSPLFRIFRYWLCSDWNLQTYLGIQIFRFYFKCTKCSAELTMKTDPQNSDYVVESGAARNFEPWRDEEEVSYLNFEMV